MLAITRKAGESVLIRFGEVEVVFRIHKLTAKSARVAIDAPDGVEIVRCELENGKSGKTDNTTSGTRATEKTAEAGGDSGQRKGKKRTPAGV